MGALRIRVSLVSLLNISERLERDLDVVSRAEVLAAAVYWSSMISYISSQNDCLKINGLF